MAEKTRKINTQITHIENGNPVVAFIGRPNVGKSTLFNRLIGKRKSIIDPTPGVTRDQIIEDIVLEGRPVRLMDTGGLIDDRDEMNINIQRKSMESIRTADLVVFIVEAGNQLPIEEEYIDFIRRNGKQAILAVNKCDTKAKEDDLYVYYNYGLGEPLPISAAHNINIDILIDKIVEMLPKTADEDGTYVPSEDDNEEEIAEESDEVGENEPNEDSSDDADGTYVPSTINIAFIGKPNVGKSSLLNKIVGKERSIVSNIAGTTRDTVNEMIMFGEEKINIIDTAGIRKKSKVTEDIEYYSVNRAIKTIENADVTILMLDSLEDVSDQDKKITDQVVKNGKGLIIALNKWDLQPNADINDKREGVLFKFPVIQYCPIIP
ncbi:MAG: ribosome biogenesis GTPase Der, partial [Spirochaetales bacterium]|nr:ribosome biogenesis GTPase Der [Spirochaetales bacterium]